MEAKSSQFSLYDYSRQSERMFDEKDLLKQLDQEAELCINEHTEDEVTAAIGMMLMHYSAVSDAQFTPKNKPIIQGTAKPLPVREEKYPQTVKKEDTVLHSIQHTTEMKRKNRKSAASKSSSLLASCRNILKEFLSQNSI
ncbi:uncharacterized protein [Musca autumnalis]|uniref:uncharacterized protein n=1 Tax=Musca autumnalis TaxID=221902 RepID=UPI003CEEF6E9